MQLLAVRAAEPSTGPTTPVMTIPVVEQGPWPLLVPLVYTSSVHPSAPIGYVAPPRLLSLAFPVRLVGIASASRALWL